MSTNSVLLVAIAAIFIILAIFFIVAGKQEKKPTNYRALFIIGIAFMPLGISTENYIFSGAGLIFMIVSLVNRKKWEKPKKWDELSYTERRLKITLIIVLSLLLVFGVFAYFIVS